MMSFSETTGRSLVNKKMLVLDPDNNTKRVKNDRGFTIGYRYLATEEGKPSR